MNEDQLNTLRQQDINLRDAIRMDEMERPQMPADLNARLMKRMAEEQAKPQRRRLLWPWIAAACVAAVIAVYLTPPKALDHRDGSHDPIFEENVITENRPHDPVETPSIEQPSTELPAKHPVQTPVKRIVAKVQPKEVEVSEPVAEEPLMAQEVVAPVAEKKAQVERTVTLTERDIPITRPENYKYTPEEIALMKKQANEAYMKWVELELEIAKNNLEQTAQN